MTPRYYHPGQNPKPRRPKPSADLAKRLKQRLPRRDRIAIMREAGLRYSPRQWRKFRKANRVRVQS